MPFRFELLGAAPEPPPPPPFFPATNTPTGIKTTSNSTTTPTTTQKHLPYFLLFPSVGNSPPLLPLPSSNTAPLTTLLFLLPCLPLSFPTPPLPTLSFSFCRPPLFSFSASNFANESIDSTCDDVCEVAPLLFFAARFSGLRDVLPRDTLFSRTSAVAFALLPPSVLRG